jgi:hypothetical protein
MSGASGIGKSTTAKAMLTELNVHLFECDGTKELKLNDCKRYAETVSFNGLKKCFIAQSCG